MLIRARRAAVLIAGLAFCFWLLGAAAAFADSSAPGTMVIDFGPRHHGLLEMDDRRDATAPITPTVPISPAAPASAASYRTTGPRTLDRVSLSPWPPVQGQTMVVWIVAHEPVTLSVSFLGQPSPVHGANGAGWALAPIWPLQKPGYTPLTIRAGRQQLIVDVPIQEGKFEKINIPAATAAPILSQTKKVNAETARMTALFAKVSDGPWWPRSAFLAPLHGTLPTSSAFGSRRTYGNDPALSAHAGQDFPVAAGTPVYAPADATVVLAEKLFVRGNAVVLDHGSGVFTGYWHLSEIDVKAGQQVKAGDLLGKVGSTGLSTGAHLHWEMRALGVAVDPLQWVLGTK